MMVESFRAFVAKRGLCLEPKAVAGDNPQRRPTIGDLMRTQLKPRASATAEIPATDVGTPNLNSHAGALNAPPWDANEVQGQEGRATPLAPAAGQEANNAPARVRDLLRGRAREHIPTTLTAPERDDRLKAWAELVAARASAEYANSPQGVELIETQARGSEGDLVSGGLSEFQQDFGDLGNGMDGGVRRHMDQLLNENLERLVLTRELPRSLGGRSL